MKSVGTYTELHSSIIPKEVGRKLRTTVGMYQSKSRAAYWDGKNEIGESVASSMYSYTLKAGYFSATRKMLIRK